VVVANSIFEGIFDRFDYELMKARVEVQYIDYCIDQIVEVATTPIMIDRVIWDHHPDDYYYVEESEEPVPGRGDYHMIEQNILKEGDLNDASHFDMVGFHGHYMVNKGVWPAEPERKKKKSTL
jgi:hypothetical protein